MSLQDVIAAQVNQYVWDLSGHLDTPSASSASSTPQISIWYSNQKSQVRCCVDVSDAANPNPSKQKQSPRRSLELSGKSGNLVRMPCKSKACDSDFGLSGTLYVLTTARKGVFAMGNDPIPATDLESARALSGFCCAAQVQNVFHLYE